MAGLNGFPPARKGFFPHTHAYMMIDTACIVQINSRRKIFCLSAPSRMYLYTINEFLTDLFSVYGIDQQVCRTDFILCPIQKSLCIGRKRPVMELGIDLLILFKIAPESVSCEIWAPGWIGSKLQRAVEHVSHCWSCSLLKLRCYLTSSLWMRFLKGNLIVENLIIS